MLRFKTLFQIVATAVLLLQQAAAQDQYYEQQGSGGYDYAGGGYGDGGDDYNSQDNLYHDYAARQQAKEVSAPAAGFGWAKIVAGGAVGWVVGAKYHTRKLSKKLFEKHKKDQKELYQQYYNDVYSLQQQNAELMEALEQYAAAVGRY